MSEEKIVLGEYELVGKNRGAGKSDLTELVFEPLEFKAVPLEALRFDKGPRSSIVIKDRKLAKSLHDEEKFRIVLERVEG